MSEEADQGEAPPSDVGGGDTLDDESVAHGTVPPPVLTPGTIVGRYVILECVGSGGMGVVYAAHDPELDRRIALKLLHRDPRKGSRASAGQRRLLREAQAMARLTHPNVATVHDVGTHDDTVFIAMEYIEGDTLTEWAARDRRPWEAVVDHLEKAGRGLESAHEVGLVHRDFKPDNVMLARDGRVRVMDFGLARPAGVADDSTSMSMQSSSGVSSSVRITRTGAAIGTPAYMAPEQHRGQPTGPAGDQFSFCVTLFECLYGQRPFPGETLESIRERALAGKVLVPRDQRGVPAWLHAVMLRGLSVSPLDRYPSMSALLSDIRRHRRRRRIWRRLAMATAAAWFLAAMGAGAWAWDRARADEAAAERERVAEDRFVALESKLVSLRAGGKAVEAQEAFDAFVSAGEHQGTRALARAWLHRADWARQSSDAKGELAAYASAYAAARDSTQRHASLLGMGAAFERRWEWAGVESVLENVTSEDDPAIDRLRTSLLLARRDMTGALEAGGQTTLQEVASALEALRHVQPTPHRASMVRAIGREDGEPELLLLRESGDGVDIVQARPGLATRMGLDFPAALGEAGFAAPLPLGERGLHVLAWHGDAPDGPRAVLYETSGDRATAVFEWSENRLNDALVADVDGDGVGEIYVAVGPYARRLYRLDPGGDGSWSLAQPHPPTDAVGSDLVSLAKTDLDGDGRVELAASVGPWGAYDVRLFEADPGGEAPLRLVARRKLGHVASLTSLPSEGLLVAAKADLYPSGQAFPARSPHGEPRGVYVLRLGDGGFEVAEYLPGPGMPPNAPSPSRIVAGDFDADGRGDLAATWNRGEEVLSVVYRQRPGGSFAAAPIHGMAALASANLDDDPGAELIARLDDGTIWVLGAGRQRLPPLEREQRALAPGEPPAEATGELRETWARAEELVSMGLRDGGVRALEQVAVLGNEGSLAAAAQHRAAAILEASGDLERAALHYAEAVELGDVSAEALAGAARCFTRVHDFERARGYNDRLLARSGVATELAEAAASRHEKLASLVTGAGRVELSFSDPLAPAWRVDQPAYVRRDVRAAELVVHGFPGAGDLAVLPLRPIGGRVRVSVEGQVARNEWGSGVIVGLRPRGKPQQLHGFEVMGWGGGRIFERQLACRLGEDGLVGERKPVEGPSDGNPPFRVDVEVVPALGSVICKLSRGDEQVSERRVLTALSLDGPLELVIQAGGEAAVDTPMWSEVRVARIELEGVEVLPAARHDASAVAARTYADGDAMGALQRAPEGAAAPWLVLALEDLGRREDARAMLERLLVERPRDELETAFMPILRPGDRAYGSLLRDVLGPGYLRLYHGAWFTAAEMHPDDDRVQQSLLTSLAGLHQSRVADLGADGVDILSALHLARGRTWWRQGRYGAARVDLQRVLDVAGPALSHAEEGPGALAMRRKLSEANRLLAVISLGSGDREAALRHAVASVELSPSPEIGQDALARLPELASMRGDESWIELLGR